MGIFFLSWVFRALLLVGPHVARSVVWAVTPPYLCLYEILKMFLKLISTVHSHYSWQEFVCVKASTTPTKEVTIGGGPAKPPHYAFMT